MAHFKVKVSHKEILIGNIKQRFIAYQPDKLPSPFKATSGGHRIQELE